MKRILTYTITPQYDGKTITYFLKQHGYTHHIIVLLKKTKNGILRNGHWAYVNELLNTNDTLTITLDEAPNKTSIVPVSLPFSIVYEDNDIVVVDKPAHMPIHPSVNHYETTLANTITYHYRQKKEHFTFRCLNRLDRDTTGLTIVAKHALSAAILNEQIRNHTLHRTYLAVCTGLVPDSGIIDAPIGRVSDSTVERCINEQNGESAITHYTRIDYDKGKNLSLVRLQLETGRTHQIRVHMKYLGYPLIGDFLYNPDYTYIKRQALHSYILDFTHPITQEKMHLLAPFPQDLKRIFPLI